MRGPVLILAGAGTGKTRVITFRIAHMIERGIFPGNILAVTFTNKAAREMQERVTKLIPRARNPASNGDPSRVTHHASRPERPTICTFHSLCVRILRQHIEKLGYKRNFVIFDESEQIGAIKKVLDKAGWKASDVDLFEVNEAFAVVTMAAMKDVGIPADKVNVHGGACALGHPIGATGARIITTLIYALKKRGLKKGVAALCIGGGEGTAIALEVM